MPAIVLILACNLVAVGEPSPSVVAPGAKLEKVWGGGTFTEGPAEASDGAILFSDIGDRIMRFDPSTGETKVFREPSGRSNGLMFDLQGRLIAAEGANTGGGRRLAIVGADGRATTLVDRFEGKRFNSPNDLTIDARGRIYFSDPRYVGDEPREIDVEGVYRVDPDGRVERLQVGTSRPNGLAVSPDGKTLYVADSGREGFRRLLALSLDRDGRTTKPRPIKHFGVGRGIDGMTVTADGKVVVAASSGPLAGVYVYEPDGTPVGFIGTPEDPTNVEFAGPDRSTLYITAGTGLYRIATTLKGHRARPAPG